MFLSRPSDWLSATSLLTLPDLTAGDLVGGKQTRHGVLVLDDCPVHHAEVVVQAVGPHPDWRALLIKCLSKSL